MEIIATGDDMVVITISFIVLGFLFIREYLRIDKNLYTNTLSSKEWKRLWVKFLKAAKLPDNPDWTTKTYKENLPDTITPEKQKEIILFLDMYNVYRFSCSKGPPPTHDLERLIKKIKQ